tara:strand:- start:97 stop:228 length:132 start_codon:yes stop_codon:yes gene_type:complete
MKKIITLCFISLLLSGCFILDMNPYLPEGWTHQLPTKERMFTG